jgi:hypothetical protein
MTVRWEPDQPERIPEMLALTILAWVKDGT